MVKSDDQTTEISLADMEKKVRRIYDDIQVFKKSPGAWDVLRYYLKGRGHAWSHINEILDGVDEFMSKFNSPPKK